MRKCAKTSTFSAVKHLFRLKNVQNRRFNLWKCAVSGCVWKGPEWILSVFKQIDECLDDFWTIFAPFCPLFDPFWAIFDHIGGYIGPFWDHFGTKIGWFWGDFGPFLGRSGVTLGSLRDHFSIVLASFWVVLVSFWPILRPFWALFGYFWTILEPLWPVFLAIFTVISPYFGDVLRSWVQN